MDVDRIQARVEAAGRRVLTRVGAFLEPARTPGRSRLAWALLALAAVVYAVVALVMTRGSIAQIDGIDWFGDALDGFSPSVLAQPHNGHPLIPTRFVYTATLRIFGNEEVVPQLFLITAVSATALMLFMLLRKQIDPLLAVVPAVVLMFLGTTTTPLDPNIAAFPQSAALGLGAFLALERRDRTGDILGCALLVVGVLTFTVGLAFVVGAFVYVGASRNWLRRAPIVVLPILVFGVWYAWARQFGQGVGETSFANIKLLPAYAADSLSAAFGALTSFDREFVNTNGYGLIDLGWGRVFAGAFVVLCVWAVARGRFTVRAWACTAVLSTYWVFGALAEGQDRHPQSVRYVFFVVALVMLIGFELLRPVRLSKWVTVAFIAFLVLTLPIQVDRMKYTGQIIRQVSKEEASEFTAIELQRDQVLPGLSTSSDGVTLITADRYLQLSDQYGSLAIPLDELAAQTATARERADLALGAILQPQARPIESAVGCEAAEPTETGEFELDPGTTVLETKEPATLSLRRFGDAPSIDAGALDANRPARIVLPPDDSAQPWLLTVEGGEEVRLCEMATAGGKP